MENHCVFSDTIDNALDEFVTLFLMDHTVKIFKGIEGLVDEEKNFYISLYFDVINHAMSLEESNFKLQYLTIFPNLNKHAGRFFRSCRDYLTDNIYNANGWSIDESNQ